MNAESRARVPPSRTNAYASDRPTASRNTAKASSARSCQVNAAIIDTFRTSILGRGGGCDDARTDDRAVLVEDRRLPGRDAVDLVVELEREPAPAGRHRRADSGRPVP